MIMFVFHCLVLAYILLSGAASAAGDNDDKTFDWLKEDDHIISSQDLRFLQKHQPSHSQPQTHNDQSHLRTSSPIVGPSEAKQASPKKDDSRNIREAARKEKKRKRNERDRNMRKQLKQFDPEGYREVLDRKNALERIRMSTMPTEKIEIRLKQRNENFKRRKANRSTVAATPQENEKRKANRRDARNRYEESLGQKIKNKEATDKQKEVFKKEFGRTKYEKLFQNP